LGTLMVRSLAYFLALAALLVQLGMAALPTGQVCLNFGDGKPACTCCGKKAHAVKTCCRTDGCERCVRVPVPERQAAPMAKARTVKLAGAAATVAAHPVMHWRMAPVGDAARPVVRADESPPQLASIRTTRLVL
jgi:hypothetical protein